MNKKKIMVFSIIGYIFVLFTDLDPDRQDKSVSSNTKKGQASLYDG
jgi:hypothetical protein